MPSTYVDDETGAKVLGSWQAVQQSLDACGVRLLRSVMEDVEMASLLQSEGFDPGSLETNKDFLRQAALAIKTINDVVERIDRLEAMVPYLKGLGARCAHYGGKPRHFEVLDAALSGMLEAQLGNEWSAQLQAAWMIAFEAVRDIMVPALEQAMREKKAIDLIQGTWKKVETYKEAHGVKMFIKLFEIDPDIARLFSFDDDEAPLQRNEKFRQHTRKVMIAIGEAVALMSDVDSLVKKLRSVGAAHAGVTITPEHWNALGQAFMWMMQQALKKDWSPEVAQGWGQMFSTIRTVMEPSMSQPSPPKQPAQPVVTSQPAPPKQPAQTAVETAKQPEGALDVERKRKIVQQSWALIERNLEGNGIKFFMRIFTIAPEALQLFSFKDAKDLEKSPELAAHAGTVMRTVGQAVAGLSDLQTLVPVLQSLGGAHAKYGVKPEHFPIVGEALLWTLEQGFGKVGLWTPEVKDAWTKTWETVVSVMEPGLIEGTSQNAAPPQESPAVRMKRLVQESWALVEKDLDGNGVKFFMRIFTIAPGALQLFSFKDAKDLEKSPELAAHAGEVMRTVGQAVAGLSDVQTLVPVLQSLGGAHAKYGVKPEHFPIVGEALLWTLEQGLGAAGVWTPEVKDAWTKTWTVVRSVMEPALIEAAKNQPQESPAVRMKRLVQESWALVEKDLDGNGIKFFMRIFTIAPGALQLFSFKDAKDLEKSPELAAHAGTVMRTVGTAVAGLSDLQTLVPVLQSLGGAHAKYGVQPEHFPIVGEALLWTLEQGLGAAGVWTPEVKDAWTKTWETVVSVMEPALVVHVDIPGEDRADRMKRLIQRSWNVVEQDLTGNGIKFFCRVFELAPATLELFVFKGSDDLKHNPALAAHAGAVMKVVGSAVAGLSDVATLVPVLQALGGAHAKYGVKSKMFPVMGQALMWTLDQCLAPVGLWTEDIQSAWMQTWTVVESVMTKSMEDEIGKAALSWTLVEKQMEKVTDLFVTTFFSLCPDAALIFPYSSDVANPEENPRMRRVFSNILRTVGQVVAGLGQGGILEPIMANHGKRHLHYGVEIEHFEIMGTSLMIALEMRLGDQWSSEVAKAWQNAYDRIQSVFTSAMKDEAKSKSNKVVKRHMNDLRLVQESWKLIEKDIDGYGVKFFMHVFDQCPEVLSLFPFKNVKDLSSCPYLQRHGSQVLRIVGEAVAGLSNLSKLVPVLKSLGAKNAQFGTKPEHFPLFGKSLLWTVQQALGDRWTADLHSAWGKTYLSVQYAMEPALKASYKELKVAEEAERVQVLVQESWALVEKDLDGNGIKFFMRIFTIAPGALQLFSFKDAKDLEKSPELAAHAGEVMRTVGQAVAGLSDVKSLIPVLRTLGGAHAKYGVQPEHFPIVGEALLWTLEQGLGAAGVWTPEVKDAWTSTWETVVSVMEPALLQAQQSDGGEDPVARMKRLVQESWRIIEQDIDTEGIKFFLRVFEKAPGALQVFSFRDVKDLDQSPELLEHAGTVMRTVGKAVAGLSNVQTLIPVLIELGGKHAGFGVQLDYFPVVGEALLHTLEQRLSSAGVWTPEVKDAWDRTWKTIVSVMEPALVEARQKAEGATPEERMKRLVQESWALVEKDLDGNGIKFFMRIFTIAPGALQLFSFKDAKDLEKSPELAAHAGEVMRTVGTAVAGLSDLQTLVPVLQSLGGAHAKYGVQPEHFPIVGEALLWTLEQGLGAAGVWTPEVKDAWTKTWTVVRSVMEPSLIEAAKNQPQESPAVRMQRLVQESWALVEKDLDGNGVKFFMRIFTIAPGALQLFSFKDAKDLEKSPELAAHAGEVMRTVGQAVAGLSDVQTLVPVLQSLGGAHAKYGVKPEHFPIVGEALLWTLEQGLGPAGVWTPEVKDAWTKTWETVVSVMEPALVAQSAKEIFREIVEESWALVEKDLDTHGIKFFMRIFTIAPGALQLFSFKDAKDLEKSPELAAHAGEVMRTVGTAVAGLSDLQTLVPVLQSLGGAHAKYGVQPEHFPIVGEALLWTLEQGLSPTGAWTPQVKEAWVNTWDAVVSVMEPALRRQSFWMEDSVSRAKRLVRQTWDLVEHRERFGVILLKRIFTVTPGVLQLFSFSKVTDLDQSPEVSAHARAVVQILGTVVEGLDHIDALIPTLHSLARTHLKLGVLVEHFPIMGESLLWTLEQHLGPKRAWNHYVKEAWIKAWSVVQLVMQNAMTMRTKVVLPSPSPELSREKVRKLVQESWALAEKDLDANGVKFFMRIFTIAPGALQLFSFKDAKDLEKSPELAAHAGEVMRTVGQAVAGLSDVQTLIPVLKKLGSAHAKYGVQPEHFPIVGEALLWTLEQGLGPAGVWTADVKTAWVKTWATVVSVMVPSLTCEANRIAPEDAAERMKRLVQDSWALVEKDLDGNGIKFFMRIFTIAPGALQLFSFKDAKDLEKSPELAAHAGTVMRTVGQAVAGLSDVETLIPVLQSLGGAHAKYGVKPEHFPIVGEALLWTLEQELGSLGMWTPEVQEAWAKTFATIQSVMEPALTSANKSSDQDVSDMEHLVQESWKLVEKDIDAHGVKFFMRIFTTSPEALQLFSFKDAKDLEKSPELAAHAGAVMRTVGSAVAGLTDLKKLIPVLQALGGAHAKYGVKQEYFPIVGEALLWTLENALSAAGAWSPAVKAAWVKTWAVVASVMEASLAEETKKVLHPGFQGVEDPETRMRRIVEESWRLVEKDLDTHGIKFFMRIFTIAPGALQLFSFKDAKDLENSPELASHAGMVMSTVGQAVAGLSDVETLIPVLQSLGGAHAKYGVQPEHFPIVGEALLWTLEAGLSPAGVWTHEVKDAWTKTWETVVSVMEPALVESSNKKASPGPANHTSRLVYDTWALVEKDLDGNGIKFFMRIFTIAPGALQLFSFKDAKDLEKSPELAAHAGTVMRTVGTAVAGLSDLQTLVPVLQSLGGAHAKYGVKPEHFPIVGEALLWTLQEALGPYGVWTHEVKDAWTKTWETVVSEMAPALLEASNNESESPAERMKRLVQDTWRLVERDLDASGVQFFKRIFTLAPGVLQLFSFKDAKDLDHSPKLAAHAGNVMRTVGQAVAGLSDTQTLVPVLQSLGGAHAKYGVKPEHFPIVGEALLWTLQEALGPYGVWTPEVKDAWTKTWTVVHSVMEPSLIEAAKKAEPGDQAMRLVQESWRLVEKDLDTHGIKFFMRIFTIAPGALQLFSFKDAKDLEKSPELAAHAGNVMRTVGQAVAGLSDVQTLVPVLQSIGGAHAKYGVQPEHFPIVGEALLWTLEQGLGPAGVWTSDVREAWAKMWLTVSTVMEASLLQARPVASSAYPATPSPAPKPTGMASTSPATPLVPTASPAIPSTPSSHIKERSASSKNLSSKEERAKRMKTLVQDSWVKVSSNADELGVIFFRKVFALAPSLLQLFPFSDATDVESDPRYKAHASSVMQTVGTAVAGLSDVKKLLPVLKALGARHAGYGARSEHFPVIGKALISTMEGALGAEWTSELKEAWKKTFATIQSVMEPALNDAVKSLAPNSVTKTPQPAAKTPVIASGKLGGDKLSPVAALAFTQAAKQNSGGKGGTVLGDASMPVSTPTPSKQKPMSDAEQPVQGSLAPQEEDTSEMDHDQMKDLVRQAWSQVSDDLEDFGMKLFMRLFKTAPKILRLFSFRDEDALSRIVKLKKHAVVTMKAIDTVVERLDNVGEMVSFLKHLGKTHAGFNVEPEGFDLFGIALLQTLEHELGNEWNAKVEEAWHMAYDDVKQVMVEAMKKELTLPKA